MLVSFKQFASMPCAIVLLLSMATTARAEDVARPWLAPERLAALREYSKLDAFHEGRLTESQGLDLIRFLGRELDGPHQRLALSALRTAAVRDPELVESAMPPLGGFLERTNKEWDMCEACDILLELSSAPDSIVAALEGVFQSRQEFPYVRPKAAGLLIRFKKDRPAELRWLIDQLGSDQAPARTRAAVALGRLGPLAKGASPILKERLGDQNPAVRLCAAVALWEIDGDSAPILPVLRAALLEPGHFVTTHPPERFEFPSPGWERMQLSADERGPTHRVLAALCLSRMGTAAHEAAPEFLRALHDKDPYLRAYVIYAIDKTELRTPEVLKVLKELSMSNDPSVLGGAWLILDKVKKAKK